MFLMSQGAVHGQRSSNTAYNICVKTTFPMMSGYVCRSRIAPVHRTRWHNDTQVQPDNRAKQNFVILHLIYETFGCYKKQSVGSGKAKRNVNNQHNV